MPPDCGRAPRVEILGDRVTSRWAPSVVQRLAALLLCCVLAILTPLAQASPPDPVWNTGIYDAADYDDVILAAAAMESLPHEGPILEGPVSLVASIVPAAGAAFAVANEVRIAQSRAPPTP